MIPYKDVQGVMNLRLIYIYLDYRTLRHFYRKVLVLLTFESTSFLWHYFMVAELVGMGGQWAPGNPVGGSSLVAIVPDSWDGSSGRLGFLDSEDPSFSILKDG